MITSKINADDLFIEASAVLFVGEVLSPSNATNDRVLKMHDYAAAGIPWYLLIDPVSGTLRLYRLAGSVFAEHSVTQVGQLLELGEPVTAVIDPADLLPPD